MFTTLFTAIHASLLQYFAVLSKYTFLSKQEPEIFSGQISTSSSCTILSPFTASAAISGSTNYAIITEITIYKLVKKTIIKVPFSFSLGVFLRNGTGLFSWLHFLFLGNPITVLSAPLGLPCFLILEALLCQHCLWFGPFDQ